MPDLGTYYIEVISAYAASLVLLVALVLVSLRASTRARNELEAIEARRSDG